MTANPEALERCPFCGHRPFTHYEFGQLVGEEPKLCRCLNPRCVMVGKICAISEWNTRYTPPRTYDGDVAALAQMLPDWVKFVAVHGYTHGLVLFDKKPEPSEKGNWWNVGKGADQSEVLEINVIRPDDWRASLRPIQGGKVVPV